MWQFSANKPLWRGNNRRLLGNHVFFIDHLVTDDLDLGDF